ncbi:MAG: hypothetical protein SGCHY_000044 [Lobulomycetales sp.]
MFVWIDLEMTGLNPYTDNIIEAAVLVTDRDLEIIDTLSDIVIHVPKSKLDKMDEWCTRQHGQSGLTRRVLESTLTLDQAEKQILSFIRKHVPEKHVGVLAGNSVHMDKEFLRREMPLVLEHLHYRLLDVSSIKILAQNWYPDHFARLPRKKGSHRALDDILESIQELKFYKGSIMMPG